MGSSELLEVLRLLANPLNLDILVLLGAKNSYPRELARILGKDETIISRRLRALEKAGLVRAKWMRLPSGKNVKIYEIAVPELRISFKPGGGSGTGYRGLLSQGLKMRLPEPSLVIGREREKRVLEEASENIVVIWGLPGVGKTTLAAWLARRADVPVYWHSCSEIDDPEYVAWRLSLFLAGLGARDAMNYMGTPGYSLRTALDIIAKDADRHNAMLVFDDYQAVERTATGALIRSLAGTLTTAKIVLVSRTRPKKLPYHEGRVLELRLDTLNVREAGEMLRAHGLSVKPREMAQIYAATMGHPLALKLYIASINAGLSAPLAHSGIIEYLWRELLSRLPEKQRRIISILAPFTEPQPIELVSILTSIRNPEPLLLELVDRGVVEKYGDHYRLHGLLRTLMDRYGWPDTYRAAARYYYSQGGWHGLFHAMKYFLEAGDPAEAAHLVCERIARDEYGYIFAMDSYEQILDRMLLNTLPQGSRACVLHDKAVILRFRGKLDEALRLLEEALEISEKRVIKASILDRIGFILSEKGRYGEAEEKLREALRIAEETGDSKMLYGIHADLAKVAGESGRLVEAEQHIKEELRLSENIDDYFYKAMAIIHLSNIYLLERRIEEAVRLLEPLCSELETYGNAFLLGTAFYVLAEAYLKSGRHSEALGVSSKSLSMLGSMGYELRRANILYTRSRALLGLRRIAEALEDLNEALRITCETGNAWLLREIIGTLNEICLEDLRRAEVERIVDMLASCIPESREIKEAFNKIKERCLG